MSVSNYAFVFDEAFSDRSTERERSAVETRLTALGLTGRDVRLAMFRSAKETIESLVARGVTTVVIIGDDRTMDKILWFLPDLDVTLGFIPMLTPSEVAGPLGIPQGVDACDVLAARRVDTIDLGICDGRYFLTEAKAVNTIASVSIDGRFRLSPMTGGTILIRNLDTRAPIGDTRSDSRDGRLEVLIKPNHDGTKRRWGRAPVHITKMFMSRGEFISPDPVDLHVDSHVLNGMRFSFGIAPSKLRVIVGKNRRLSPSDEPLPGEETRATLPTFRTSRNKEHSPLQH